MTLKTSLLKMRNNILILGGGYIGSYLKKQFDNETDTTCHLVTKNNLNYFDNNLLETFIYKNNIEYIINCVGFTGKPNVDEAESKKEECWKLNVVLPLNLSKLVYRTGVKLLHISSGCIYAGYDKEFTENDIPNFGLYDYSSFYSKSKHAFETLVTDTPIKILRIRMPICPDLNNPRNFLNKILKYENLIDFLNSKTYIPDLYTFINRMITSPSIKWHKKCDIYNVVNPNPLYTRQIIDYFNEHNMLNYKLTPKWVNIEDLDILAPRSNCVLDNIKSDSIFKLRTELELLSDIRLNNKL